MSASPTASSNRAAAIWALALAGFLLLGGCSLGTEDVDTVPTAECGGGLMPAHMVELYFGRSIAGGGAVSDKDWRKFLDEVASPAFPDGFTATDAEGRYLDRSTGISISEPSKVLTIVVTDLLGLEERVGRLIDSYKRRFEQQSVLRVDREACIAF